MTRRGFTLLEVLIVVIIIGILAAIAMPQCISTLKKAKAGKACTNLGSIRTSMDRYYYEQIAMGDYTQLSGVSWMDDLDVEIDTTGWGYTISDTGDSDARDYEITATYINDSDLWVKVDEDGAITKSPDLGG